MSTIEQPKTNETVLNAVETKSEEQSLVNAENKSTEHQESSREKEGDENIRFLLGQKLSFLNTAAKVCMSWWVSSIVFCGTILAVVWFKRGEFEPGILTLLSIAVTIFFASFILFGMSAIWHLREFEAGINNFIGKLKLDDSKQIFTDVFKHEINSIRRGIIIGIGSFILVLIVWIIFILIL